MTTSGMRTPRKHTPVSRGRARLPHLVERDVHEVAGLLAQGKGGIEIIAHFQKRKPAPSSRRIREWIARARRQWVADHKDELPTVVESTLTWLRSQRDWCKKNGHPAQMARYDCEIVTVLGLRQPDRHLHLHAAPQGPAQAAPDVSYAGMDSAALDALEEALRSVVAGTPQLSPHPDVIG